MSTIFGGRHYLLAALTLAVVANLAVVSGAPTSARLVAAIVLAFCLPGAMLVQSLFADSPATRLSERIVLSLGASVALTVWLVWLVIWVSSVTDVIGLLVAVDIIIFGLAAIAWVRRGVRLSIQSRHERLTLSLMAVVGALSLFFGLARLGYPELMRDERDVMFSAVNVLMGREGSIYALAKGPAQTLLVIWFARLGDSLTEGAMRLPFALCALIASLAFVLLARMRLRMGYALIVACLFVTHGLLLYFTRLVQYQMFVMAMALLAIYCALRASHKAHLSVRYWTLATLFAGAGALGHYDIVFVAPALALLFFHAERRRLAHRQTWVRALALAIFISLIVAPFYAGMLQDPLALKVLDSLYLHGRVSSAGAPFNHLNTFLQDLLYYESYYRALPTWGLMGLTFLASVRRWSRAWLIAIAVIAMLSVSVVFSADALRVAGVNLGFAPVTMLFVLIITRITRDPYWRAALIWLAVSLSFPAFVMALPIDHYFVGIPAMLLVAGVGLKVLFAGLRQIIQVEVLRPIVLIGAAVWLGIGGLYAYLQQIAYHREIAIMHPECAIPFFSQLYSAPDRIPPRIYQVGWRAVAALYETGVLRGEYDFNDTPSLPHWYLYNYWNPPVPSTRYFMHAFPQKAFKGLPDDLEQNYALWGTISVDGEPQMTIYQRKPLDAEPRSIRAEDYEAAWAQIASLSRFDAHRKNRRDDSNFYALGKALLKRQGQPEAIIFDRPDAGGIISRYYVGGLPYVESPSSDLSPYQRVWSVVWGAGAETRDRALAARVFLEGTQQFGNIRLRSYFVAADPPLLKHSATIGDVARVTHIGSLPPVVRTGETLPVRIEWQAAHPDGAAYKFFLHLADERGVPLAQSDGEPLAGWRPTNTWQAGEAISERVGVVLPPNMPPGTYRVVLGMYDPGSGARLPAIDSDGMRYPHDAVLIGEIRVLKD